MSALWSMLRTYKFAKFVFSTNNNVKGDKDIFLYVISVSTMEKRSRFP